MTVFTHNDGSTLVSSMDDNLSLVWMRETDLDAVCRACNLAGHLLDEIERQGVIVRDMDGDPLNLDDLNKTTDAAGDALMRAKYVPPGMETLRLILKSD